MAAGRLARAEATTLIQPQPSTRRGSGNGHMRSALARRRLSGS